jgi:hypothetical protein
MATLYRLRVSGRDCGRFEEHDPAGYIAGMMKGVIMLETALRGDRGAWNDVVDSAGFEGSVPERLAKSLEIAKEKCKI